VNILITYPQRTTMIPKRRQNRNCLSTEIKVVDGGNVDNYPHDFVGIISF